MYQWISVDIMSNVRAENVLRRVFRCEAFRPLQREVIDAVMKGDDVIVIMATGGGKSLCFQLPAVLADGLTVVVSPLLSLITDQVVTLQGLGVKAFSFVSESCDRSWTMLRREEHGSIVYTTPEQLAGNSWFRTALVHLAQVNRLRRIVLDEAHCICTWGTDFRCVIY